MNQCPHCNADLRGEEIPLEHRQYYGTATHFKREILIEISEEYDGGLFYRCPDCGGEWHRFRVGHPLRESAERHMRKPLLGSVVTNQELADMSTDSAVPNEEQVKRICGWCDLVHSNAKCPSGCDDAYGRGAKG